MVKALVTRGEHLKVRSYREVAMGVLEVRIGTQLERTEEPCSEISVNVTHEGTHEAVHKVKISSEMF